MINVSFSERFLAVYSGCLTFVFLITVLCGFSALKHMRGFDEITVHRINIVEPDGTIRMVLTNKDSEPGLYNKNKEYPHDTRQSAGLLFFDDEGTENGGLIYGLTRDQTGGTTGSNLHLSFDKYMQDQVFTIDAGNGDHNQYSELTMQDRRDYPILEAIDANHRISKLPEEQRAAEWAKFTAAHPGDNTRVVLGRADNGAAVLRLKDWEGRDRIVIRVAPDGTPKLQMLGADGTVVDELPPVSKTSPSRP
jgi:hypothetical protein